MGFRPRRKYSVVDDGLAELIDDAETAQAARIDELARAEKDGTLNHLARDVPSVDEQLSRGPR